MLAQSHVHFRPMQEIDLPIIVDIEQAAYPFPWSLKTLHDCLRVGYHASVLERISYSTEKKQTILGYGFMSIGTGEAHILNLCVHPENQRCGYGHQILLHLIGMAKQEQVNTIFLEVRASNQIAIHLYSKAGFNHIGMRKDYYPAQAGQRENALTFALTLSQS